VTSGTGASGAGTSGAGNPGTRPLAPGVARTAAHGRVSTPEGWPVAGATVTVLGGDGGQLARATAGDDGRFTLDRLPAGPGTLLVAAPAHEPRALTVVVPAGPSWAVGELRLTRSGGSELPAPGLYLIDTAHSTVSARAHHLGLAAVTGRFTEFAGAITVDADVTRSRVDAEIVASSIATGNTQRDAHLRSPDFLDVERFPTLRFEADGVERAAAGWVLPGRLTLAGTTRPVQLDLTYLGSGPDPWGGTRAAFTAITELRRQDFQLNWNQAVGVGIAVFGTTLRVTIDVEAVLQP
jgi:polyisoprenoid-binding protein YceI